MTRRTTMIAMLGAVGVFAPIQDAEACGGFFCNNANPVDQSAERILFAVDEDAGEVTTHIQIFYQGEAEKFAWVVPAPSVPDLFVSTDQLFAALDASTQPTFDLQQVEDGHCEWGDSYGWGLEADDGSASDTASDNGVSVISEEVVGPYNATVLQAESTSELLDWLQDNGYDLPDTLEPALSPYVAGGQYFVAIKLLSDKDIGDIQPLGMTYEATKAMVPIQLTSIAATDDMRLEVYILGAERAVPESYLHVQINEAAVDWFNRGANYEDVITLAADEAGGHAFATDYSGTSAVMDDLLYQAGDFSGLEEMRSMTDPIAFMEALMSQGFIGNNQMLSLLRTHMPLPDGVPASQETDFYNCLSCYDKYLKDYEFFPNAFVDDLELFIVDPLKTAQATFDAHGHLSRLTSSLDAVEMTADPVFTFNGDMQQEVTRFHEAEVIHHCGDGGTWSGSDRTLKLADGRSYSLPSQEWMWENGVTEYEYLRSVTTPTAQVIEETGGSGEPKVIADYTEHVFAQADAFSGEEPRACGGCATGAEPAGLVFLASALGLVIRRRREH